MDTQLHKETRRFPLRRVSVNSVSDGVADKRGQPTTMSTPSSSLVAKCVTRLEATAAHTVADEARLPITHDESPR